MRGKHHNSQEVSILMSEVNKMSAEELNMLHGIVIDPVTKEITDDVSGLTYKTLLDWANSVYEDEPDSGCERIGKFYGFDDD